MDESDRELRERLRAAVERGGPDAGLEVLAQLGLSVEKEPEPGVGMRMRFGAGTDDAFSTTMYAPGPDRPSGWPADVPFLPGVAGSLTLFERADRGCSVQWFHVPDPSAALNDLAEQCVADGWRVQDAPDLPPPMPAGSRVVVLGRGERQRTLMSVVAQDVGIVQLVERRPGGSCALPVTPPRP